jgi:N-acetyl-1-D-myo-inositol-2-amino-2-deoxy-alpha-D-glucopyranoside deacetylase
VARVAGVPDEEITTLVDVRDLLDRKRAAFAAHVSQNGPHQPLRAMAANDFQAAYGTERFVLARGRLGEGPPERDLFAGL